MVCATGVWAILPAEQVMWLMREEGAVETTTSAVFFALALGLLWWRPAQDDRCSWLAMAVLCAAAGAREMDWHKAWTGKSVLKVSYYLGPAPWGQKLVALALVLLVAASALYLWRRHARRLWQAMQAGQPDAGTVATLVATTVITKLLDRSINVLAEDFGVATSPSTRALVSALEETMELGLPLMVALALWQYLRRRRAHMPA